MATIPREMLVTSDIREAYSIVLPLWCWRGWHAGRDGFSLELQEILYQMHGQVTQHTQHKVS